MRSPSLLLALALVAALLLASAGCASAARHHAQRSSKDASVAPSRTAASSVHASTDPVAPDNYCITWTTNVANGTAEPIVLEITRKLAPLGADRLYALMQDRFFDTPYPAAFFRVVPKFVVQFGIAGSPFETAKWNVPIQDDPVLGSNTNGTISFATAGPNTRTSQLFINTADNAGLDSQGFSPLGKVIRGMETVLAINNPTPGSSDGIDQDKYTNGGYRWIEAQYPMVNSIIKSTVQDGVCN